MWRYQREVIRNRKQKRNRKHNCQKERDKRTNNDLQNSTQKTKDRATRIPLITEGELRYSRRVNSEVCKLAPFLKLMQSLIFNMLMLYYEIQKLYKRPPNIISMKYQIWIVYWLPRKRKTWSGDESVNFKFINKWTIY